MPPQVPLWVPLLFVLQWLLLLLFSVWAEPWLCGTAAAVTACGVPLYYIGVRGARRLPALQRLLGERGPPRGPVGSYGGVWGRMGGIWGVWGQLGGGMGSYMGGLGGIGGDMGSYMGGLGGIWGVWGHICRVWGG